MRSSIIVSFLFVGFLTTQECRSQIFSPQEEAPEAVNLFYLDLTPYGEWIQSEPGLYAWHPTIVDPSWRPYTRGRWVWSDYGWYWVTAEPFGWATYHYGRWFFDDNYRWIWIPDAVWGPAWVEWRCNDDYIGWAPLPPYARFHVTTGIRFTRRWSAPPVYWSFISYDHFASGHAYHNYVSESNTRRLISTTRSAGRYQIDQNRIIDQGIDRTVIERRGSSRIETAEVSETRDRGIERLTSDGTRERIEIYRPRAEDAGTATRTIKIRRTETRPSLDIDHVDRSQTIPQRDSRLERPQRREITPDRKYRTRPEFPSPKVDRMIPRRSAETRDQDRSGKRRDKF